MIVLAIIFFAALWSLFSSFFSGAYNIQSV
jgi:hypothetical protein